MLTEREKTVVSTAVLAAVGVGVIYVLSRYRKGIMSRLKGLNQRDPLRGQQVHIVNTADDCRLIVSTLHKHCQEYNVLGFDCEWVNNQGKRRPVAMLQLASHRGLCALIRLCAISKLPQELYDLLNDDNIVKVGVSPYDDARLLREDYMLKVESTLDLRFMAERAGLEPFGIARLANEVLGLTLDKHWKIRCSDWEAPELSDRQIKYAASDAHVAVELFKKFAYKLVPHYPWTSRKVVLGQVLEEMDCFVDQPYNSRKAKSSGGSSKMKAKNCLNPQPQQKAAKRNYSTRTKPLYHNCLLEAPDGELLCTCDRRKAEWYVQRELGDVMGFDPYTVRLRFEPSGRAVNEAGKYYQQTKENICVVCGADECFNRKNIVPRDYRKHFPVIMKEHVSHDVLLLCADCHQRSNITDERLRQELSEACDAPLSGQKNGSKEIRLESMAEIRKAARALLYSAAQMPPERRQHLEQRLLQLVSESAAPQDEPWGAVQVTELTPEVLQFYSTIDVSVRNELYCAHGERVVEYFKQRLGGLSQLERMWREHFLKTMRPKHLPALWSVDHNYKRLESRAGEGRVDLEDLAIAGISLLSSPSTSSTRSPSSTNSNTYGSRTMSDVPSPSTRFYSNRELQARGPSANGSTVASVSPQTTQYKSFQQRHGWTNASDGSSVDGSTVFKTAHQSPFSEHGQSSTQQQQQQQQQDSELATERDFASLQLTYDSDDSNSTLSQPSSTLLNSNGTFPDDEDEMFAVEAVRTTNRAIESNGSRVHDEDDTDERSLSAVDSLVTDSSSSSGTAATRGHHQRRSDPSQAQTRHGTSSNATVTY